MVRLVLSFGLLVGCATAAVVGEGEEDTDGPLRPDSSAPRVDAYMPPSLDGGDDIDPDAPIFMPPSDGGSASCGSWMNLLSNGNLDSGGPGLGWSQFSAAGFPVITSEIPFPAPSTPNVAWFNGYPNGWEQLWQDFDIPDDTVALRVSGQICIATESTGSEADQFGIALFQEPERNRLEIIKVWSQKDGTTSGECTFTSFELETDFPYGGVHVDLLFEAVSDGSQLTSFFVDSLKFEAQVCP